jgi:DNA-binding winged helix-turn-helix (wHTH) protein/tetratricopeptide (TPR) repeat protein
VDHPGVAADVAAGDFSVGEWVVRPRLDRIERADVTVQLEPKVMDLLVCLAHASGEVVSKDELLDTVWGKRFVADATLSNAVAHLRKRLGDDARAPRFIETIPKRGYRLLEPVGAVDPGPPSAGQQPPDRAEQGGRRLWLVAIVLGVVGAAAALLVGLQPRPPAKAGLPSLNPRRLLVEPLVNRSGDPSLDPVAFMAADWVAQGLSLLPEVEVIPVASTVMGVSGDGSLDAGELARKVGAGTLVTGAYYGNNGDLVFNLALTNARTGRLLQALPPVRGVRSDPMAVIGVLRERAMGAVAVELGESTVADPFDPRVDAARRARPPLFAAYAEYIAGMRLFGADYPGAIRHFRRAAELDPAFPAPLFLTHGALVSQGRFEEGQGILDRLQAMREVLTPFENEMLDFKLADQAGHRQEALEHLRRAEAISPADLIVKGLIAGRLTFLNRLTEALAALDSEQWRLGPGVAWWPASMRTKLLHLLGRHEAELAVAREAVSAFPHIPELRACEARALAALGRSDDLGVALDASVTLPAGAIGAGEVMIVAAEELRRHGFAAESETVARRAAANLRDRNGGGAAAAAGAVSLALAYRLAGDELQARALLREYLVSSPEDIDVLGALGCIEARLGHRDEAGRIAEQLAAMDRPFLYGGHLYAEATVLAALGERDAAVAAFRRWLAAGGGFTIGVHADPDLEPLRGYPSFDRLVQPR